MKYTRIKRYTIGKGNKGANKNKTFLTKKDAWFYYFVDRSNTKTFLNRTASAEAAGYSAKNRQSLSVIGSQNFKNYKDKIGKWLDDNALSEEALKGKLTSLLDAKEQRFFSKDGVVVTTKTVAALEIQRKSLDMAYKAKGMYQPKRIELSTASAEKKKKKLKRLNRNELESIAKILEKATANI